MTILSLARNNEYSFGVMAVKLDGSNSSYLFLEHLKVQCI